MGHVTITTPLSGTICRRCSWTSYDSTVYRIWNIYIHSLRRYERWRKIQKLGWFLPRDAMLSAVYAVVVYLCVCVCVCVSVCLSHSGIVSKRLNIGSRKQRRTIAPWLYSFLMPKIMAKFERDHPLRGRQMQVGWVKIGHFWQKTRYNSKTVQDRRIVSIKVE